MAQIISLLLNDNSYKRAYNFLHESQIPLERFFYFRQEFAITFEARSDITESSDECDRYISPRR